MSIKKIRLSKKKGGTGYVSSYTVSIGRKEAEMCEFEPDQENTTLCKIVDKKSKQIIIKQKGCLLTHKMVADVMEAAKELEKQRSIQMKDVPSDSGLVCMSDIPQPNEAVEAAEMRMLDLLSSYSQEELTDLATLLEIGLCRDADMTLEGLERFLDYWGYLSDAALFEINLINYIVEKSHLDKWLQRGIQVLMEPVDEKEDKEDFEYD